jgi:hypothetical protein
LYYNVIESFISFLLIFVNTNYNQKDGANWFIGYIFVPLFNNKHSQIMKNLVLFILPLFIFSCKLGVESFRPQIEELGTNWDNTTKSVTEFANSLTTDISGFTNIASTMTLSEDALKGLKPEMATKYAEATTAFSSATAAFGPIQSELGDFNKMWVEKSQTVENLKKGLAEGKIEGDVKMQIADLTALIAQATEKLSGWQAKQTETKAAADAASLKLKEVYEMITVKK